MRRSGNGNGGGGDCKRAPLDASRLHAILAALEKLPPETRDEIVADALSALRVEHVVVAIRHFCDDLSIRDVAESLASETETKAFASSTVHDWLRQFVREFPLAIERELARRQPGGE